MVTHVIVFIDLKCACKGRISRDEKEKNRRKPKSNNNNSCSDRANNKKENDRQLRSIYWHCGQ